MLPVSYNNKKDFSQLFVGSLNPDLGEFVSTIYSRQFKPQKVQAHQLAVALKTATSDDGNNSKLLGTQPKILEAVQKFLRALSDVMFRQPQSVLVAPKVHSTMPANIPTGTSEIAITHRPVSLAMVRLRTWSSQTQHIGYELHVHGEAAVAAALVASLWKCSPDDDIFVATPHRIQREAVKAALARINIQSNDAPLEEALERVQISQPSTSSRVTVDTIERLQGQLRHPFEIREIAS